ncbi:hypothetical protein [Microbacterium sp. PMB16]|uniref:hypothetical protein n=1 Tax=Microbacterium sp. PMB16 TaxID=3120157 RepID=UPI003F4BF051
MLLSQGSGSWFSVIAFVVLLVLGIVTLRSVRKDTRAFEARHGADAGVQNPVT